MVLAAYCILCNICRNYIRKDMLLSLYNTKTSTILPLSEAPSSILEPVLNNTEMLTN
jgi:hypothetical protein